MRKEPVFFLFSSCFVTRFNWFGLSWVAAPIWAYVIWMQNFSLFFTLLSLLGSQSYLECRYMKAEPFLFFHLVLSLLGSQSFLGCCYLKAEPFPFFHLVLSLLGSQSCLGCCYLKAEPFLFFTWFCLSWVVSPIWAVVIWRQNLSLFFTWFWPSWVVVLFGLSLYEGRTFPFFHLVLSLLGSRLIWAVVIWRQNLSLFFTWFWPSWVVVLFGLSLYEGRTFPFFSPGSVSLE